MNIINELNALYIFLSLGEAGDTSEKILLGQPLLRPASVPRPIASVGDPIRMPSSVDPNLCFVTARSLGNEVQNLDINIS